MKRVICCLVIVMCVAVFVFGMFKLAVVASPLVCQGFVAGWKYLVLALVAGIVFLVSLHILEYLKEKEDA